LNAHVQSQENTPSKTFFSDLIYSNGTVRHSDAGPDTLSDSAWQNWFCKHQHALCERWIKDLPDRYGNDPNFQAIWPSYRIQIDNLRKQDELQWGNWYARHGGGLSFLGDHVVGPLGETVPLTILGILLAGLVALFVKQTPGCGATHYTKTQNSRESANCLIRRLDSGWFFKNQQERSAP
jgi:hypothetical protein